MPESRAKHSARTIRLPFAIIPSVAQPALPDPVVHIAGGPGVDALSEAEFVVPAGLNRDRDLIILAQRGTLDTEPALTCPEIDQFNARAIGLPYASEATKKLHLAATQACHDRLVAAGIDLSAFNSTENAADFADLRRALGVAEWNVYAYSYGTYIALRLMRDHPEGIRSVTIDSVLPPSAAGLGWTWSNVHEAFDNLFRACAEQDKCRERYGDLGSTFTRLVNQYEAHPVSTTGQLPHGGASVPVMIDGGTLVNWLASARPYSKAPSAIDELAKGQPVQIVAARAALADSSAPSTFAHGMTYSVFCRELIPFEPASAILSQGRLAFAAYPDPVLAQAPQLPFEIEDCAIWNVPAAPASERAVTRSDIPTLVIAGAFDAKTSPQWAAYVARTLSRSTMIVIPGIGHWVSAQSPCAQRVVASFLAAPSKTVDTSCVASLATPAFE